MTTFKEFNKYFKNGEQVFIGFREGNSHGYISNFDEHGIYLIQINHSKEYFYNWNQCEVICHAGYAIKQVGQHEAVKLIMISLERQNPNTIQLAPKEKKEGGNALKLMEDFKKENFNFAISISEASQIMEKHFPDLFELYASSLYDYAARINLNNKKNFKDSDNMFFLYDFPVNPSRLKWKKNKSGVKDELRINGDCVTGKIKLSYGGIACQLGNDITKRVIVQKPAFDGGLGGHGEHIQIIEPDLSKIERKERKLYSPLAITKNNIDTILNTTKDDLQKFIDEFSYIYSGDPYELSGKPISSLVFQSDQGFCLLNNYSELYAGMKA